VRSLSAARVSALAWLGGAVMFGVLVLYATLSLDLRIGLSLVAATLALTAFSLYPTVRTGLGYAVGALLIIGASSTAISASETAAVLSVGLRVVGFGVVIVLSRKRPADAGHMPRSRPRWIYVFGVSLACYFVIGAAFHGQVVTFVLYSAGLVLLVAAAVRAQASSDPQLRIGVVLALSTIVGASLLYGLAVPSVGYESGRLRGFLENANTLGFFAFLLGASALILVRRSRWRVALLLLAAVVLVLTASRASALALVLVVLVLVARRGFLRAAAILLAIMLVVSVAYVFDPTLFDPLASLLRLNDSRSDSTSTAVRAFLSNPLIGVGVGNESSIIASSPFRALAQAGVVGLLAVLAMWVVLVAQGRRHGARALALAVAAIVHSIFEGWLLSPVSPLLAVFVLLWIAVIADDHQGRPMPQPAPAATPRPVRPTRTGHTR